VNYDWSKLQADRQAILMDGYRIGYARRTLESPPSRSQDSRPDSAGHVQCVHCGDTGIKDTAAYCPTCGTALHAPGAPVVVGRDQRGPHGYDGAGRGPH